MGAEAIAAIIAAVTSCLVALINAWRPKQRKRNQTVDALVAQTEETEETTVRVTSKGRKT